MFKDIILFVRDPISRAYNKEELEEFFRSMGHLETVMYFKRDLNIVPLTTERKPFFQHLASRLYDRINK